MVIREVRWKQVKLFNKYVIIKVLIFNIYIGNIK